MCVLAPIAGYILICTLRKIIKLEILFLYSYFVFTNDSTPPSNIFNGPTFGDHSQIAVGSVMLPGTK
jgi:hypothetical protein